MDNTALLIKRWDEIIKKHILCSCGEVYTSRGMAAPDCPYHAQDWETPMVEFLKELAAQSSPIEETVGYKYSFEEQEPKIGQYICLYWADGSECECTYNGIDKSIKPMPYWSAIPSPIEDKKQVVKQDEYTAEILKCKNNAYYFATTYLTVNDKPFTTPLSEKAFNNYFENRR